jgi:pimeloyl-ACP methyl ester carboxylesterase
MAEWGTVGKPALVLLHGWPQNWTAFAAVMTVLAPEVHGVALDLPGIGGSMTPLDSSDKRTIARHVRAVVESLKLSEVTLAGHDVGGMIAYAYLHAYPDELERAAILNVAIPGVDPWGDVVRNPHIWHFAFHAVPDLPERLVSGRQAEYFDYFYDTISASPDGVPVKNRARYVEAYSRPEGLHTGFEWYRAFAQGEKDNAATEAEVLETPVLHIRGDHDQGSMEPYLRGLRRSGLNRVEGRIIPNCGHFSLDEQPELVASALLEFIKS